MFGIGKLTKAILELADVGRSILKWLRLGQPGLVFLKVVSQEGSRMQFVLVLPTPGAPDVAEGGSREVVASVAGAEPAVQTLAGAAMESDPLAGLEGDSVVGTLVDIDNNGNRSEPREFNLTIIDNLAPPLPGEVGIRAISED